ncbi:MAG: putative AP superfamily [Prolixibacteraceae bacterium]|nr:MAG: putative AP superfamily [Prolixibacteraceae bacterium]
MKVFAKASFIVLIILVLNKVSAQHSPFDTTTKPKVVIGVVIENMRPDYIQRYWNKFEPGGFKKLYTQGAVCTNVRLTQQVQNYASGTATLFTGVNPSMHGIINKNWYDKFKEKETECTEDNYYVTVGSDTKAGNASPKKLLSNTITDILKINSMGKSKVFSAALNRESAIFSAGHAADGAYWFDYESGRMISSSFYINIFPDWVRLFNSENYAEKYSYRNWVPLLPEATYTESLRDDYMLEKGYFGKFNTFPHTISKYIKETRDFRPFKTTPSANLMIKDFVIKLIENESIGTDSHTDFITTVFSSMDYENGSFGPASLEMQDTYLHIDKYIAELIEYAQSKFGKENVMFFLTANTSASYPVDYLKEEFNLPVDYFNIESAIALLTSYLNITYGEEKWIEYYDENQIYINHKLIAKNKLGLNEFQTVTSSFIDEFEGVLVSMPAYLLERGIQANGMLEPLYKTYVRSRSGDCHFMLKEGWQPVYKFKKINYTDQSHIPLVFYGPGIRPGIINGKYDAIDFVPTLSEILKIPLPDKSQGKIISEIIR